MEEVIDPILSKLAHKAEIGSVLHSFKKHDGFKIYEQVLHDIVQDRKNKWLEGTDEQAKIFRYQAQGVQMALGVLNKMVLEGVVAREHLKENAEPSLEPQQ